VSFCDAATPSGGGAFSVALAPVNAESRFKRGLTLELSRPRRRTRLAVRRMIGKQRCAAKRGRRSGSALERLVRPHCVRSGAVRGDWSLAERPLRSG